MKPLGASWRPLRGLVGRSGGLLGASWGGRLELLAVWGACARLLRSSPLAAQPRGAQYMKRGPRPAIRVTSEGRALHQAICLLILALGSYRHRAWVAGQRLLGYLFGVSCHASRAPHGATCEVSWCVLGAVCGPLGASFGTLGGRLGACWRSGSVDLGRRARNVRWNSPSWAPLRPSRAPLGPSWGSLGPSLGSPGGLLDRLGAILGASWAVLGAVIRCEDQRSEYAENVQFPKRNGAILGIRGTLGEHFGAFLGRLGGLQGALRPF